MIFNGSWPLLYLKIPLIRRLSPILWVTAMRNHFLPDFFRCYSEYVPCVANYASEGKHRRGVPRF